VGLARARAVRLSGALAPPDLGHDMSTEQNTIGHEEGGDRQRKTRTVGRARSRTPRPRPAATASASGPAAAPQRPAADGSLALVLSPAERLAGAAGAARAPLDRLGHARRLVAAAQALREFPFEGLIRAAASGHAGLSRESFEDQVAVCEAAQLEAFEQALALAGERAGAAFEEQEGWPDRVRAALLALLEFFDSEPVLARYLVVGSALAGPAVLERRGEVLDALAGVLDDELAAADADPGPLMAQAALSGVLGVVHRRLSPSNPGPLIGLVGPLTSFIELPFLGAGPAPKSNGLVALPPDLAGSLDDRTIAVLLIVGEHPGLSTTGVALRLPVEHRDHASLVLRRLLKLGLAASTRDRQRRGAPYVWQLTRSGIEVYRVIRGGAPAPKRSVALELMMRGGGPLGERAIAILRVIGAEPGLSNRPVGDRVGITGQAHISQLLARLLARGLIENTCDAAGVENEWQLTFTGEELDRAIWAEIPAAEQRSIALEMLRDPDGHVSEQIVTLLGLIAAEPGLNSAEVAVRVGVWNPDQVAGLLALLARLWLIESAPGAGSELGWRRTASGEQFAGLIGRGSAAAPRSVALALMLDSGGRLSDRAISLLRLIGGEPGLNDRALTRRAGLKDRNAVAGVLADLLARGLIENARRGGRANVWRLTATGEQLERALWAESSATLQLSIARDLLQTPDGRLDEHVLSVLELISFEPGLSDIEIADRAGVEGQEHASGLLARLARLSLIESPDVHGPENAWQQTANGRALLHGGPGTALPREAPSPSRGVALDLIREFGGLMTQRAVSALKVIERQPGLGSRDVARRIGVTAESHVHELFALLTKHDLAKNVRAGGHENQWRLTPGGQELQGVLWGKASPAHQRSVALDLMRDFGGGMSESLAAAFRLIATEPGLGNSQIRERVGISDGHISNVLARLTRTGLIENARTGLKSDWQPTASGSELVRAILEQEARDAER
jgi:DNA-binding MarR family transcriptional regulator